MAMLYSCHARTGRHLSERPRPRFSVSYRRLCGRSPLETRSTHTLSRILLPADAVLCLRCAGALAYRARPWRAYVHVCDCGTSCGGAAGLDCGAAAALLAKDDRS